MNVMIVLGAVLLYLSGVVASYVFTVVYYYHRPESIIKWYDPPPKDYKTDKEYKLRIAKEEAACCTVPFLLSWAFFVLVLIVGGIYYLLTSFKWVCNKIIDKLIK